jgi:uncharacterized tellurite resistance protein B-like protein
VARKKISILRWVIGILLLIWLIGKNPENTLEILFVSALLFGAFKWLQHRNPNPAAPLPATTPLPQPPPLANRPPNSAQPAPARQTAPPSQPGIATEPRNRTAGFQIPPPPKDLNRVGRWIPKTETIQLGGMLIQGGMVYFGTYLPSSTDTSEPALINPQLALAEPSDFTRNQTNYWPNYSDISPTARKAYIGWLADGRKHPDADIGYVFLYFYGLERRILRDGANDPVALSDRPDILIELKRLAAIYSPRSNSFKQYCAQLIQFLELATCAEKLYEKPVPALLPGYEFPFYMRLAIGQAVVAGKPIAAHLASAWVLYDPTIQRRTAATRCADEFLALFPIKYRQAYGDGLKIDPNRTKLKFAYHPASAGFHGEKPINFDCGNIPDVAALTKPIKKLQAVVDECATELSAFSRFIGKSPEKRSTSEALLQLPVCIWPLAAKQTLAAIQTQVAERMQAMQIADLLGLFGAISSLDCLRGVAKALESSGIGMEPAILLNKSALKPGARVVLFKDTASNGAISSEAKPSAGYQAALVTVELAAAVAHADGDFSDAEVAAIDQHIGTWQYLTLAHQQRLKARVRWLVDEGVSLSSLKKKIEPLDSPTRHAIASFTARMAQADGMVTPDEVRLLEKMYKLLGIEQQQVYSQLHAASAPHAPSGKTGAEAGASAGASNLTLDSNKIAMLQQESAQLQALLNTIFTEEHEADTPTVQPEATEPPDEPGESDEADGSRRLLGLDAATSAFARMLLSRPTWSRSELEDVAHDLEVMLDGTLEQINEATLDAFNLMCTEGDDPIEVNPEIFEKLPL